MRPLEPARREIRDTQRDKLYAVERTLPDFLGHPLATEVELHAYVARVMASRWWRDRSRAAVIVHVSNRTRQRATCAAGTVRFVLTFPRWSWRKAIVLHELAHQLVRHHERATGVRCAGHGREFARLYLEMLRRFLGRAVYLEFRDAFRANGIKYAKGRKGTGAGNTAALAAWRERTTIVAALDGPQAALHLQRVEGTSLGTGSEV